MPVVLAPLLYHDQLDITEERQVMVPQTSPEVSLMCACVDHDWSMYCIVLYVCLCGS